MGRYGVYLLWCHTSINNSVDGNSTLTDIDPCTKCKKRDGYVWHWGNISDSKGYAECKSCGAKF